MTDSPAKLALPEVLERFRVYHRKHLAWGSLHIVLDDGNVSDKDVDFSLSAAERDGDEEGAELARILRRMSQTQRRKLGRIA